MGTLGFPTICVEHPFLSGNHPKILWMLKVRPLEKIPALPRRKKLGQPGESWHWNPSLGRQPWQTRTQGFHSHGGSLWLCQNSYWKWPFVVSFPIQHGDFPVRYVNVYYKGKVVRALHICGTLFYRGLGLGIDGESPWWVRIVGRLEVCGKFLWPYRGWWSCCTNLLKLYIYVEYIYIYICICRIYIYIYLYVYVHVEYIYICRIYIYVYTYIADWCSVE